MLQLGGGMEINMSRQKYYAYKNRDDEIRRLSTSGGAFYTIAEAIINRGGVVFGAAVREDCLVEHICVNKKEDLFRLQGSKYLQSRIGDTFTQAKNYLKDGVPVLFSGTPCQIAGLRNYLGKNNDLLYTCDIICHGVSSPLIWKKYIEYKEKQLGGKVSAVSFRNKKISTWSECHETITINGTVYDSSEYAKIFYDHEAMRQACYKCRFTNLSRPGDITLGDFWGVDKVHPEIYDELGVSFVMCNSDVGEILCDYLKDNGELIVADISQTRQPQLYKPVREPATRKQFWKIYDKEGISKILKLNNNPISRINIKRKTIFYIKKVGKKIIALRKEV